MPFSLLAERNVCVSFSIVKLTLGGSLLSAFIIAHRFGLLKHSYYSFLRVGGRVLNRYNTKRYFGRG